MQYGFPCDSALAVNIVMTSGEVGSKEGHGGGQAMVTLKPIGVRAGVVGVGWICWIWVEG
jgi:hypothetical protein